MAIVLEVREHSLCFLDGKKSGTKVFVKDTFQIDSETSLIEKGIFKMSDSFKDKVLETLKNRKVKKMNVHVIVNYRIGITKELVIPKADSRKTELMVTNEMSNIFNLKKDFLIDYRNMKSLKKRTDRKQTVLATAIPTDFVMSLDRALKEINIKILSLDLAQSSFLKFVETHQFVDQPVPTIIVDLGANYIRSYLYDEYEMKLMRSFYTFEEESFKDVMDRLIKVIDLLEQSYYGQTGRTTRNIYVLGSDMYVPNIKDHYSDNPSLNIFAIHSEEFAKGRKHAATEYVCSLGALL